MKRSHRELSIMVIHRGIFKNSQITLFLCLTFIPKTAVSFYRATLSAFPGLKVSSVAHSLSVNSSWKIIGTPSFGSNDTRLSFISSRN